jgi:peptidyl-prolyl cis-trans isomerase C
MSEFSVYKHRLFSIAYVTVMGLMILTGSTSMAASPILLEADGIVVTAIDIDAEVQKVLPDARNKLLAQPESVSRIATNIYVRRALAAKAEKDGLVNNPTIVAALQLAREKVLSEAVLSQLDATSTPNDDALNAFTSAAYKTRPERFRRPEEIRARHILIEGLTPEAKAKADKLLEELKAGADFNELASTHSSDKASAVKGGDLGFFAQGKMVKAFNDVAFALKKPGDLSAVIETQFGYHIIRLDERRAEGVRSFDEVRAVLKSETLAKLLNDVRLTEEQRLIGLAKYNREAIDALASSFEARSK